ncbi:MAG TPA: TonB-dependent receptor, partial [Terriglobales bacterium]|nr:TonB-dependent receptor [Terriglobales bacterium]
MQSPRMAFSLAMLLGAMALFFSPLAACQNAPGWIAGTVLDTGGAVLQGAEVELQPKGVFAVSNATGGFIIKNLLPGTYTVKISYEGFAPFSIEVNVNAGSVSRVDAVLKVASKSEQITVSAERPHGEAEAINRERTSENILQVLPAEVITSLPNTNIADALGRLPSVTLERDEGEGKYVQIRGTEPRLSNVTVNGIVVASPEPGARQIKLDIMPADLVESVEINKTLSPNQDGDAIGGSVNLVTKTAGEKPTVILEGIGGYNSIIGGRNSRTFDGTLGQRFGQSKKLGVLFGGTYDWNGRGIDDIEPAVCDSVSCGAPGPAVATYNTMDLREYRYYRERWGFTGSLDYKLSGGSNVYLHTLYSHFNNFGDRWVYTPTINTLVSPFQGDTDGNMAFNAQIRRPVEVIGSLSAGGHHVLSKSWFSWDLAAARSAQEDQGYSSADFGANDGAAPINNVQFGVDLSNPNRPKLPVQNGVNIYDPAQYELQDRDNNQSYSPQLNLEGGASYGRSYTLGGHAATFEFGGKVRNAHKFEDASYQFYDFTGATPPTIATFRSSFSNSDYYDKSYTLGPLVDYNKINAFFAANPGAFTLNVNRSRQRTDPNNFDLVERVSAGYLMNTVDLGRFHVQAGLRFEATQEDVLGYHVTFDAKGNYASTTPLVRNSSYLDPLPSAQVRYAINSESGIRVGYGRGIARPGFSSLPPFFTENDKKNSISVGNPDLKATHAHSFDVLYEHYLKPLGILQAGFFYKDISDPIYSVTTLISSGAFAGFHQTQPVNGSSAWLTGFELAYQQHLGFLPGAWSGFGIAANYSYTTSQAHNVPGRTDNPALLRQAPHTFNISPTYDRGRLSMRVGVSYNAANIFSYNFVDGAALGKTGPNGDQYLYAHTQVDAQGSFRLAKGFSAIVSGLNLTNEVFGFYQGSAIYPIQREYYHPTISAG